MNISIFGLGYVGCVSLGCLAKNEHRVTGVDINNDKVELINKGLPTIIEKDIDRIIFKGYEKGLIKATTDYRAAIKETDISFICVGTPSMDTGQLNLEFVYNAARQIAEGLKEKSGFHVIVIRSTILPGTNEKVGSIMEEISGKKRNIGYAVVSNPEFLREGSAVEDYYNPAITVVGSDNEKALNQMKEIYKPVHGEFIAVDIKVAEMIKYVNNTFHALKISYTNEVGNICKALGVDSFKVMELFKMDTRLNISASYLNPGMAYGGSCLPKDLKGLATIAHDHYVKTPLIEAIETSNYIQKDRMLDLILKQGKKKIGLWGVAFKKGTDDLRFSPPVSLAESLLGKGYHLLLYDRYVHLSKLTGTNKSFIEQHLPHISVLLKSKLDDLINEVDIMVICHKPDPDELKVLKRFKGTIIDLVRLPVDTMGDLKVIGLSW